MKLESRRFPRRSFGRKGWIKVYISGVDSLVPCTIADASAGGARLVFRSAADIPDKFVLRLSQTAQTGKACRVAWRKRDAVGVEFI